MHYIDSYIIDKLVKTKLLRNKDMRPPGVESNLYQYHLKRLLIEQYVKKIDNHYTLAKKGLTYAGKHSSTLKKERPQPQVLTILFVVNESGNILIRTKQRQPFIGMQGLVMGKMHIDETIQKAAIREFAEKVSDQVRPSGLKYFGTAHLVIAQEECIISDYIGLLVAVHVPDDIKLKTTGAFYGLEEAANQTLSPGVALLLTAYKEKAEFIEARIEYDELES